MPRHNASISIRGAGAFALALASVVGACGGSSTEDSTSTGGSSSGGNAGTASGGASSGGTTATGGVAGQGGGTTGGSGGGAGQACMADKYDGLVYVNYDQFSPVINSTCSGTNHQDIQDVERVVFLGDSITVGTFPTPANQVYRVLLTEKLKQKWPNAVVESCAVNGATTSDFFSGDNQITKCFPAPEQKKTLVIFTMGGNDIAAMAKDKLSVSASDAEADKVLANMQKTLEFLTNAANFPNGSYVVFANVYEYTDLTADLSSCPTGNLARLTGEWLAGTTTLTKLREGYMKIAVDTQTDMIFLGEHFCGHGYKYNDTTTQCYEPNSTNWFDITCIHPTPAGHAEIVDLFWNTITE
jgi:hypothetical protein